MIFRPFPVLTLLTLPALAFLVWLGDWQLDRRAWKTEMIAEFERSAADAPVDLGEALCHGGAAFGRRVDMDTLSPGPINVRVYGVNRDGAPGWRVFAPVVTDPCQGQRVILAETGFQPLETAMRGADGRTVTASQTDALRFEAPAGRGPFTPANDPDGDAFYAFDREAMAQALEVPPADIHADWWLAADDGSLPPHLSQTPPERHLGYAVTWFLMAAALISVYLLFHARAGRLRLRHD
jgi:surfeit locus 1 family protein